ncbi:MAG: hypothetical protein AAF632_23705 [Bacteroidota bacterium]
MKTKLDYSFVIRELTKLREIVIEDLRTSKSQELTHRKSEIDLAIKWLIRGQEFDVHPKSKIIELPYKKVQTPSSEYRIVEDCESDNPDLWMEVQVDGESIRPLPGSLIIERI